MSVFFEIHQGLPREGPGSAASARRALSLAKPHLPERPSVVEAGCGPGGSLPTIASELPGARITAFDLHAPFVEQARALGVPGTELLVADMTTWRPTSPVDLVWCEGAAYFLGVPAALARFHDWLRPGGVLVFSEAVWLVPPADRPERAVRFWREYPAMDDIAHTRALVDAAGFARVGDFVLPADDWRAYYRPQRDRIAALRPRYAGDAEALAELDAHDEEIAVFDTCGHAYSYLLTVATRR